LPTAKEYCDQPWAGHAQAATLQPLKTYLEISNRQAGKYFRVKIKLNFEHLQ